MTRKEWMQMHYPEKVGRSHAGGVANCQTIAMGSAVNAGTPKSLILKRRQK